MDAELETVDERRKVERWRFSECLRFGVPLELAIAFSEGDGDLHRLEDLIESGCSPALAAQIA